MMKTETNNVADIAQGVRDAARERAEVEHGEAMTLRRELAKEERARMRELEMSRKEKRSTFYYAVAMLFLTSCGIGGLTPFFTGVESGVNWYSTLGGFVLAIFFAVKANNELKA